MDDLQGDKRRFKNEEALLDLPGTSSHEIPIAVALLISHSRFISPF